MKKPYTLLGWFRCQDKETIKKIKEQIKYTSRENMTDEDYADAFFVFVESNTLLERNARGFDGDEEWLFDFFSCFWTFASKDGDWCADDFNWVVSDAIELLAQKGYK